MIESVIVTLMEKGKTYEQSMILEGCNTNQDKVEEVLDRINAVNFLRLNSSLDSKSPIAVVNIKLNDKDEEEIYSVVNEGEVD